MHWAHSAAPEGRSLTSPPLFTESSRYTPVSHCYSKPPFSKSIFCIFSLLSCLHSCSNLLSLASSSSLNCSYSSEGHWWLLWCPVWKLFSFLILPTKSWLEHSQLFPPRDIPSSWPLTPYPRQSLLPSALLRLLVCNSGCTLEPPKELSRFAFSLPSQDCHLIKKPRIWLSYPGF